MTSHETAKTEQLIGRAIYRPINPRRRVHQAGLPAAPAGLEGRKPGTSLKLELLIADSTYARNSSSATSRRTRSRSGTSNCACRRSRHRAATVEWCRSRSRKYLPPGYTLARNVIPAAPTAPHLSSGATPNNNGQFTLAWEPTQAATATTYTLEHKNADGGWSTRRQRSHQPRIHLHERRPRGRRDVDVPRHRRATKAPKANLGALERSQGRETAPNPPTASATARRTTRAAGAGTRTASKCRSARTAIRICQTEVRVAA